MTDKKLKCFTAHQGDDYTVVMADGETTDNATVRIYGEDRDEALEIAQTIADELTERPGIHGHITEKVRLAQVYAEDGAFRTAARVLNDLATVLKAHADATMPG